MKIIIDITHASHVNIFKHVINKLVEEKHEVYLIGLKRGRIPSIMKNDLHQFKEMKFIGKWNQSKFSIIFQANIIRSILIFFYIFKIRPNIGISSGSIPFSFALKLMGKPVIDFSDDPERKFVSKLETILCTEKYYPPFVISKNPKIKNYNCLKQWGYLNPNYFIPDENALQEYNVKAKKFIFIREVSTASLNYSNQTSGLVQNFANKLPNGYKVIFSLENKSERNKYPEEWILLKEPVNDIHSLIYYSKYLISSGDSMAREGSILGVPSIYCGNRTMGANEIMIKKGMLFHIETTDVISFLNNLDVGDIKIKDQEEFRNQLKTDWVDLNEFIIQKTIKR